MNIIIRPFHPNDLKPIGQLFYDTVHTINRRDYTQEQIDAWAPDPFCLEKSDRPLEKNDTFVAEVNGQIVGFGDISPSGYLDRLYVHKDFQGHGIASGLLKALESRARDLHLTEIKTEASITAKEFFLARDFLIKEKQVKLYKGTPFINYKMSKKI